MNRTTIRQRRQGFTLIEALLASVLLAMVVTATLAPFTAGLHNERYSGLKTEAVALAEDLMEEILAKPFYDPTTPGVTVPGPEWGENSRELFDNIDDYHGLAEAPGEIRPYQQDIAGQDISEELSRDVTVEYVHLAGQDGGAAANVCRVIVQVGDGTGPLARLSRLIYGDMEE